MWLSCTLAEPVRDGSPGNHQPTTRTRWSSWAGRDANHIGNETNVLELLATTSDAARRGTAAVGALALALDTEREEVESHPYGLATCDLARRHPDGRVRVTTTGGAFLELDAEGAVVVDPSQVSPEE